MLEKCLDQQGREGTQRWSQTARPATKRATKSQGRAGQQLQSATWACPAYLPYISCTSITFKAHFTLKESWELQFKGAERGELQFPYSFGRDMPCMYGVYTTLIILWGGDFSWPCVLQLWSIQVMFPLPFSITGPCFTTPSVSIISYSKKRTTVG